MSERPKHDVGYQGSIARRLADESVVSLSRENSVREVWVRGCVAIHRDSRTPGCTYSKHCAGQVRAGRSWITAPASAAPAPAPASHENHNKARHVQREKDLDWTMTMPCCKKSSCQAPVVEATVKQDDRMPAGYNTASLAKTRCCCFAALCCFV